MCQEQKHSIRKGRLHSLCQVAFWPSLQHGEVENTERQRGWYSMLGQWGFG